MDKEKRRSELLIRYYERDKDFRKAKWKRIALILLGFTVLFLIIIWRLRGISKGLGAVGDIVVAIVLAGIHFALNGAVFWVYCKKSREENTMLKRLEKELNEIDDRLQAMKSQHIYGTNVIRASRIAADEKLIADLARNYYKKDKQYERSKLWRMILAILFFSFVYFVIFCHFFGIPRTPFDFSGTPKEILAFASMIFVFFVVGSIHFWINFYIFIWLFLKGEEEKDILERIKKEIYELDDPSKI